MSSSQVVLRIQSKFDEGSKIRGFGLRTHLLKRSLADRPRSERLDSDIFEVQLKGELSDEVKRLIESWGFTYEVVSTAEVALTN